MGLDFLDVTFRIEEEFDVKISMDDVHKLGSSGDITVGDLFQLVLSKLHLRDTGRHDLRLNRLFWEEMQATLQRIDEKPDSRIQLSTPLTDVFPREERRDKWTAMLNASRWQIPKLEYPGYVGINGFMIAVGVVLIEHFHIWRIPGAAPFWPILGMIGLWMVVETYLKIISLCAPLRTRFPAGCLTVKDLCRDVLARNYAEIVDAVQASTETQCVTVWSRLSAVLTDVLDVPHENITLQARLHHDLGAE